MALRFARRSRNRTHAAELGEARFAQLLAVPRPPDTPQGWQEEKVRQRLAKQQDHWLTFLDYPEVDATSNLAERQLRPPSSVANSHAVTKRSKGQPLRVSWLPWRQPVNSEATRSSNKSPTL